MNLKMIFFLEIQCTLLLVIYHVWCIYQKNIIWSEIPSIVGNNYMSEGVRASVKAWAAFQNWIFIGYTGI